MALLVKAGGGENVTPQVETYESLLETAIANLAGKAFKPMQSKTVTPTAAGLTVTPDEGRSLGEVIINGDADLIPENIREGVDIFGVLGAMSEGVSGIDYGYVTPTNFPESITIEHNLNEMPTYAILTILKKMPPNDYTGASTYANLDGNIIFYNSGWGGSKGSNITKTNTSVVFRSQSSSVKWPSGCLMLWVVVK